MKSAVGTFTVSLLFAAVTLPSLSLIKGASGELPGTYDNTQKDYNVPGKVTAEVVDEDFAFRGFLGFNSAALWDTLTPAQQAQSPGGFSIGLNQNTFPITNYAGVSSALLVIKKKGQVPPHMHPRANALLIVIKGGPLRLDITDSNNTKHSVTLDTGDVGYIPQGLMHVMENLSNKDVLALHQFSSGYAGTLRVVPALFASSGDVLSTAFNGAFSSGQFTAARDQVITGYPLQQPSPSSKKNP